MIIERMLEDYGRAYGMASVSLRYFNAGGGLEGVIGRIISPKHTPFLC